MPYRDPAKEKYWRGLLRQWRGSALTVRDFCAEHGITEPRFYSWRREIERRNRQRQAAIQRPHPRTPLPTAPPKPAQAPLGASRSAFVELAIESAAPPPAIEVVLSERRLLRVRPGFDADVLRQLLRLLEEPSC